MARWKQSGRSVRGRSVRSSIRRRMALPFHSRHRFSQKTALQFFIKQVCNACKNLFCCFNYLRYPCTAPKALPLDRNCANDLRGPQQSRAPPGGRIRQHRRLSADVKGSVGMVRVTPKIVEWMSYETAGELTAIPRELTVLSFIAPPALGARRRGRGRSTGGGQAGL